MSAQEAFAAFLRDRLAPALRARGFKGSGQVFRLPDDERFLQMGIQKSVHNTLDEVTFTINLQAVSHARWAEARAARPYLPERPTPNTRYPPYAWSVRAGSLMPGLHDRWWTVRADTDLDGLESELLHAVDTWLIPALQERRAITE